MKKKRVKLFESRGSQAVRLPEECRLNASEVLIYRKGCNVIIEPIDEWPEEFRACLGSSKHDIPRLKQKPVKDMRNPFA